MYNKSKTLPTWFEAFRRADGSGGLVYGPPLGPIVLDILESCVIPARIDPLEYLYGMMTQQSMLTLPNGLGPAVAATVRVIPGHAGLCQHTRMGAVVPASASFKYGPSPGVADIVVVGKHPADDEDRTGMLFSGASGRELRGALADGGIADFLDRAYFTNICWFNPPKGNFKKTFTREFAWFLWAELMAIQPRLVLIFGSDAIKHFYGNRLNVTNSRGQLMDLPLMPAGDTGDSVVFKAFATMHPAAVARENTMRAGLTADLKRVSRWFIGDHDDADRPRYADHWEDYVLDTVDKVRGYVEARIRDGTTLFSVDCEWEGRSPFAGGKLLTIQISHAEGESALVPVHRHPRVPERFVKAPADGAANAYGATSAWLPGLDVALVHCLETCSGSDKPISRVVCRGDLYEVLDALVEAFQPAEWQAVRDLLRQLFLRPGIRVGGHNFKSDLHWLKSVGLDLTEPFSRGFDTMLQHHLIYESGQHGLEVCALKYTSLGRYDFALGEYLRDNEGTGLGFGHVPESVLYPYALYDPDASLRIHKALNAELDAMPERERNMLLTTLASDMAANVAIVEMEETGLLADRSRILDLADRYSRKFEQILADLRSDIRWPTFNPRSVMQCRELLFGESYSGKVDESGNPVRLRPPGADCRNLTPVKTTGRPARDWATIVAGGQEREFSPSTDKETLGILGVHDPVAATLRSLRFVDQVVKLYVSLPQTDPDTGETTEGGLLQYIDPDGRIRTTLLQLAETGRWMSRAPNCFSGDTELLTTRGWLRFDELKDIWPTLRVAQYDQTSGEISFVAPDSYVEYRSKEMTHVQLVNGGVDLHVTPDHECLLYTRGNKAVKLQARNYPTDRRQVNAGRYRGGRNDRWSDDFMRLLVMVQADGCYRKRSIGTIELGFQKARKITRCRRILRAVLPAGTFAERRDHKRSRTRFTLYQSSIVAELMDILGPEKKFGPWILGLSRRLLNVFLDEIWHWNGCFTRRGRYSSNIKDNVDMVQAALALSDCRARLRKYNAASSSVNWQIDVTRRNYSWTTNVLVSTRRRRVPVYCVRVPLGNIVVRRNGACCITGQCQNLPSRREPQLHKYFEGEPKPHRLRSVFMAPPEHVLIEADYSSAELIVIGLASGDMDFYHAVTGKHRFKAVLVGDNVAFWLHPEHFRTNIDIAVGDRVPAGTCLGQYRTHGSWRDLVVPVGAEIVERSWARDLHGEQAIASFRLPYDPVVHGPPKGFVESTAADKRVAAKSVNFGIPYGRSANAVARELQQEGIWITADETQTIIDNVLKTYGLVALFLDNCKRVMREDGVLWTMHGRRRHFAMNVDESILAGQERESGNFPIQGEVACCLDRAVANFRAVRSLLNASGRALNYRLVLAIHDAVMLQVPASCVEPLIAENGVIDYCMRHEASVRIPLPDRSICGGLYANVDPQLFPYALPVDKKVVLRWGETPSAEALRAAGLSESAVKRCMKG